MRPAANPQPELSAAEKEAAAVQAEMARLANLGHAEKLELLDKAYAEYSEEFKFNPGDNVMVKDCVANVFPHLGNGSPAKFIGYLSETDTYVEKHAQLIGSNIHGEKFNCRIMWIDPQGKPTFVSLNSMCLKPFKV